MKEREDGLLEIHARLKAKRVDMGVKTFVRTPTKAATQDQLPCIFMLEETDVIISHSKRNGSGYPCQRALEVVLELAVGKETDIKELYREVRKVVFTERDSDPPVFNPKVTMKSFINENRTEGPTGYGLPDVVGMRLVLDLVYTDDGL